MERRYFIQIHLKIVRNDCNGTVPPIGMILRSRFEEKHISGSRDREYKSWINSLSELAKALDDSSLDPNIRVGVEFKVTPSFFQS